jgi:hypothetical protein
VSAVPAVGAAEDDEVDVGFDDLGQDLVSGKVPLPDPVTLADIETVE